MYILHVCGAQNSTRLPELHVCIHNAYLGSSFSSLSKYWMRDLAIWRWSGETRGFSAVSPSTCSDRDHKSSTSDDTPTIDVMWKFFCAFFSINVCVFLCTKMQVCEIIKSTHNFLLLW